MSVRGTLTLADGHTRSVEANRQTNGSILFWVEGASAAAIGRPLNHAPGLVAGHTTDQRPFYAAFAPDLVVAFPWLPEAAR